MDAAKKREAWAVLAQVWVDTDYDDAQMEAFRQQLLATGLPGSEIRRIAYHEVCGAFALFTLGVLATAGMALPDWYYPEELAQEKVAQWLARPLALLVLNPFWVAGYVIARWFMRSTLGGVLSELGS